MTPTFGPTSGTFSGWFGIGFAILLIVLASLHGLERTEWQVVACACFGAVFCWVAMLRPRVVFEPSTLVLRNMVSDTAIPYGMIDRVTVRSTTCAFVGQRRYVGLGVGRSRMSMTRKPRGGGGRYGSRLLAQLNDPEANPGQIDNEQVPTFVEEQAWDRISRAAREPGGPDTVRRTPAVPEIAALLLGLAGVVVAFVI